MLIESWNQRQKLCREGHAGTGPGCSGAALMAQYMARYSSGVGRIHGPEWSASLESEGGASRDGWDILCHPPGPWGIRQKATGASPFVAK